MNGEGIKYTVIIVNELYPRQEKETSNEDGSMVYNRPNEEPDRQN